MLVAYHDVRDLGGYPSGVAAPKELHRTNVATEDVAGGFPAGSAPAAGKPGVVVLQGTPGAADGLPGVTAWTAVRRTASGSLCRRGQRTTVMREL